MEETQTSDSQSEGMMPETAEHSSKAKSGAWTIFKYGVSKTVGGQTAFSIFKTLAEDGTLEGDFESQPQEALNRYNDALNERYTKKDITSDENQRKIAFIRETDMSLHQKYSRDLELAKVLAQRYFDCQKAECKRLITEHFFIQEPNLATKRDTAIRIAEEEYARDFSALHQRAQTAVLNASYLRIKTRDFQEATHPDDIFIDTKNVETPKKYLDFIHGLQNQKK